MERINSVVPEFHAQYLQGMLEWKNSPGSILLRA
jgi:hypothetical protein